MPRGLRPKPQPAAAADPIIVPLIDGIYRTNGVLSSA
jgi:hypothetical protein